MKIYILRHAKSSWETYNDDHDRPLSERGISDAKTLGLYLNRKNINKSKPNPMLLEVFNNIFMSIAEQMGVVLENTAQSVTIKERLDFSCAVFDNNGDLIANAPHMPVHLGSMDASVKAVINKNKIIKRGDVFALNAPYDGGTHLPDITVIKPIFNKLKDEILFFVAA